MKTITELCNLCGHERSQHGREADLLWGTDSKRELCLECPGCVLERGDGAEVDGYPRGQAWHRFDSGAPTHDKQERGITE